MSATLYRSTLIAVLALALAGCAGGALTRTDQAEQSTAGGGDATGFAARASGAPAEAAGGATEAGQDSDAATDRDAPDLPALGDPPPARPGDRVIKEGTVTVRLAPGEFDRGFAGTVAAARRFGGDVLSSATSTDDAGRTSGTVTVRVPVERFEDLLVAVGEVGEIRGRDIRAQDVSAEFVDLESRLRHLQAQERFYLGLLEEAESVGDAIAVQQQLDDVQAQIERIRGRLGWLEDRTAFSTLTVELYEAGAAPGTAGGLRPTLSHYWQTARDAFVNVVGALLVAALFLTPLAIVAAAAVGLWMVARPRHPRRRRDESAAPAEPPADDARDRVGAGN